MIIEPSLNKLLEKVDSRYTLAILAAKRARQISEGATVLTASTSQKPVTVAVDEIGEDKITYVRTRSGIK